MPEPTAGSLALAEIFALTEALPAEIGLASTVSELEASLRLLADRFAVVMDDPLTDQLRDGYVGSMAALADMYSVYGPVLESANPALADVEAFTNENLAITEQITAVDALLFATLDQVLRERGTATALYFADVFDPIGEYSEILGSLTTLTDLRPSEELLAFDTLASETGDIRLELEALTPPPDLEDLHDRQVSLIADADSIFLEFLDLLVAREEPGVTLFLALGALQRDSLVLREERSAAVTAELRGETR